MQKDKKFNRKVLVFDLGGGTFDVSILNIKNNTDFQVVTSSGDTDIGGDDFDYKLVDFCINKFCNASKIDETEIRKDKNIIRRLKIQCEKAKKKLSNSQKTTIIIYNFIKNLNLYVEITRDEFNTICEDLYQGIKIKLDTVIKDSKFTLEEIDDIVVVGGASRIPKIRTILMEKFGEKKVRDQINPDEAVATGATWQAHKILKFYKDINIIDITPFSLGFAVRSKNLQEQKEGSIMSILIPKDKEISCRSEARVYTTVEDNQKFFRIRLYAGEDKFCKNNNLLKELEIKD
jgi:L1 cell adhesion molecule like protein